MSASFDPLIDQIATYVQESTTFSTETLETAIDCLFDTLGCGVLAVSHHECSRLLGDYFQDASKNKRSLPLPGTNINVSCPIKAAFDLGALNRWVDYNDTWLAKEWGHPSDNFAALFSLANTGWSSQPLTVRELLHRAIQAYEIQGVLALNHAFNEKGFDHVMLVKLASTAAGMAMLVDDKDAICRAISQTWVDGQALRTYRHAPNTGSRKSWAAGDACARAIQLIWMTLQGEMGYPSAVTADKWGYEATRWEGKPIALAQPLSDYVMKNVLFKVAYPAEFHAQTAVEAAFQLSEEAKARLLDIERIEIETQEAGHRIIDKTGPLHNPADRDHCLQYMVGVALLDGKLTDASYLDARADDPVLDTLRAKMVVKENPAFTKDYFDSGKRAIPNSVQLFYENGESSQRVEVAYPIGHPRRREEARPLLKEKFRKNVAARMPKDQMEYLMSLWENPAQFLEEPPTDFLRRFSLQDAF